MAAFAGRSQACRGDGRRPTAGLLTPGPVTGAKAVYESTRDIESSASTGAGGGGQYCAPVGCGIGAAAEPLHYEANARKTDEMRLPLTVNKRFLASDLRKPLELSIASCERNGVDRTRKFRYG